MGKLASRGLFVRCKKEARRDQAEMYSQDKRARRREAEAAVKAKERERERRERARDEQKASSLWVRDENGKKQNPISPKERVREKGKMAMSRAASCKTKRREKQRGKGEALLGRGSMYVDGRRRTRWFGWFGRFGIWGVWW